MTVKAGHQNWGVLHQGSAPMAAFSLKRITLTFPAASGLCKSKQRGHWPSAQVPREGIPTLAWERAHGHACHS